MRIPFRIVDVFTDVPLAGNQLCVIPDPVELEAEQMLAIAREIGFSETTFVSSSGGHAYSMRIFTPGGELPFAGHPSLGTAFVLVREGRVENPVVQSVLAGDSVIEVNLAEGRARMRQMPPWFGPEVDDVDRVAASAGLKVDAFDPDLPPQAVSTGFPHLMAAVRDEASVSAASPDARVLDALMYDTKCGGLYLFAHDDVTARARLFAHGIGIEEDPATGSAAGPLGAFLYQRGRLNGGRLTVTQGVEIHRPSTLQVEVEPDGDDLAVFVSGGVVPVGEGVFDLPL